MSIQLIIIIYLFYFIPYILLESSSLGVEMMNIFYFSPIHLQFFTPLISFTIFIQVFFSLPFNPIEIDE